MTYEQILTETRGRVGVITLNRPDRLNAMTATMHRELRAQMREWNVDEGVGAMVITGAGRGFCSGADIGGFEQAVSGNNPSSVEARPPETEWDALVKACKPILCAINGVAVGEGITLTLPCDVRVASEEARLSFRFVRLGLTPEFGSSHYLSHLVGLGRAMELMLTGRFVLADEAEAIGLVTHVYPAAEMLEKAVELAQEIADGPSWQLGQIKRMVRDHFLEPDMAAVLETEHKVFAEARSTEAHREALRAFRERREPRFH
ncbi:MAG: enoyl-CoA hydratase/isomerase family protein [Chloroflexi bacterium]|nr:enoyl-CoA hydratase/isomerase family protein [Chloroflexota bacterium]